MATSSLVQFGIAALAPQIATDLSLSTTEIGALVTVYYLTAALLSPFAGRHVDRISERLALLTVVGASGLACLVLGVAPSIPLLVLGLILAGVGAAAANPATNRSIAAAESAKGLIVGMKQSGIQVSALLAGAVMTPIAVSHGWRVAFLIAAGSTVLLIPAVVVRGSASKPRAGPRNRGPQLSIVRPLAAYAFFMGATMSSVMAYLAIYAHQELRLSASAAGALVAVIGLLAVIGRILWSLAADRAPIETMPRFLAMLAWSCLLGVILVVAAKGIDPNLVWVAAAVLGFTGAAWNGVVMLSLIRIGPEVGTSSGNVQSGFFFGLACTPILFGVLVDLSGTFLTGWCLTMVTAIGAVCTATWVRRKTQGRVTLSS